MPDLLVVLRTAVGVTLLIAAIGKVIDRPASKELALSIVEGLVGVALLFGLYQLGATLIATVMSIGFLAHAIQITGARCQCFGRRLPSTSRAGQIVRSGCLLTACGVLVSLQVLNLNLRLVSVDTATDLGMGVLAGAAIIVLPWILGWSHEEPEH